MAYFELDFNEYDYFDDDEDWWDEYSYFRDEKDAYWANHYSKVFYNLPDSKYIFNVNLVKNYLGQSSSITNEDITYEKLHSVITKIEKLFMLWQKRLSHEWNKEIKRPLKKSKESLENGTKDEATAKENGADNKGEGEPRDRGSEHDQNMHSDFAQAVQALEEFGFLHACMVSPRFSDDEDFYGYYESDEWDSSLDEMYVDDEHLFKENKSRKDDIKNESISRYKKSAEKFYSAFPEEEDANIVLSDLLLMKSWINNLFIMVLTKCIGQQFPQLVIEKIIQMLQDRFDELQLKVGNMAKTERFIAVEKLRRKELYAALLEIHSLFFEILFKNNNVSNTIFLKEYVKKLFHIALRRLTMLEELISCLQGDDMASGDCSKGFMSGVFYCKLLKSCGRNLDYLQPLNDAFTSLSGKNLAILVPGGSKESCVKVYDVFTYRCTMVLTLAREDVALGVALQDEKLAILLKKGAFYRVEIHKYPHDYEKKPVTLELGTCSRESLKKLLFVKFGECSKLLAQKEDNLVVISVAGKDDEIELSIQEAHLSVELLAAKGQYAITRDIVRTTGLMNIPTVGEIVELKEKHAGIKVFDLKTNSCVCSIRHPKREDDVISLNGKWSATFDTASDSLKFIVWDGALVQLWDLEGKAKMVNEFTLTKRVATGTKLAFNNDVIAVQNTQNSFDGNYDTVSLTETLFYEMSSKNVYYHETYHSIFEKPQCHIASSGGHIYDLKMTDGMLITLHSSTNGGEIRIYNFGLSHERIIGLQMIDLEEAKKEEELRKKLKEAEKKRQNEERMRKKEEQRLKRLEKKRKQREMQQMKRQQADKLKFAVNSGSYVVGEITEWRGTYGFLRIEGMGDAFIHITDIQGRPRITPGCRIHCQLEEQIGHPRPKAICASLLRF